MRSYSIIKPFITYKNSLLNKLKALNDKHKSGIYKTINYINNKCYIKISVNLHSRFLNYNNKNHYNKRVLKSPIYKALLKHEHENLNLEIL